jgi:hypothetical protein
MSTNWVSWSAMIYVKRGLLYRRLILCRRLATGTHLGKAGSLTLLGESIVSQDVCDVPVLDDEEWLASIPELDLRYRLCCSQLGVFCCRLDISRASKGEFRWSCLRHC